MSNQKVVGVVGCGIVGLATALKLQRLIPGCRALVFDKEPRVAAHQTGNNSDVVHSTINYQPGSLKAKLTRAGADSLLAFAAERGVPFNRCGKVVPALEEQDVPTVRELHRRGVANGGKVRMLTKQEAAELEPLMAPCVEALLAEDTAVIDYARVTAEMAKVVEEEGGKVHLGTEVRGWRNGGGERVLLTSAGEFKVDLMVLCAGLHSDVLARAFGLPVDDLIIAPFRGEYLLYQKPLDVKHLIYPVRDITKPFLDVHICLHPDGRITFGPNAVLSLAREGYNWGQIDPAFLAKMVAYPGLQKLILSNWRFAARETYRSWVTPAFIASCRKLIPTLDAKAFGAKREAGVRAQALMRDGTLVDDFVFREAPGVVAVLNAPSPAATAGLEIGAMIVEKVRPQLAA